MREKASRRAGRHEQRAPAAAGRAGGVGELVGAAQEGLKALSVGVGLGVLAEVREQEVAEVVGEKPHGTANPAA